MRNGPSYQFLKENNTEHYTVQHIKIEHTSSLEIDGEQHKNDPPELWQVLM